MYGLYYVCIRNWTALDNMYLERENKDLTELVSLSASDKQSKKLDRPDFICSEDFTQAQTPAVCCMLCAVCVKMELVREISA